MNRITNWLSGLNLKAWLIACALSFAAGSIISGLSVGTIVHKVDQAAYNALQSRYDARELAWVKQKGEAEKRAAALQKAQDDVSLAHAVSQAQAQERVVYRTQKVLQEVPHYVTPAQDARGCVTYGLVRVLDAAALGVDPGTLQLPAGKSDDTCSPIAPSALASSVAGNYGVAWQNAEQLDGLIAYEKDRVSIDATAGRK